MAAARTKKYWPIASATTQIAVQNVFDVGQLRRAGAFYVEQFFCGARFHHHAGRAEAALAAVVVGNGRCDVALDAWLLRCFDCRHAGVILVARQNRAGGTQTAVDGSRARLASKLHQHGARTTVALAARDVRAHFAQRAKRVDQRRAHVVLGARDKFVVQQKG